MTVVACNYPSPSEQPELEPARKVKERERQVRGRSAKAPPTLDADVHQELEATDALLGDPDAVRAFVFDAAQRLAISVTSPLLSERFVKRAINDRPEHNHRVPGLRPARDFRSSAGLLHAALRRGLRWPRKIRQVFKR